MNTTQCLDAEKSGQRHAQGARAAAVKTFCAQLTPEQQAVFNAEARPGSGHGHDGKMHHQS